MQANLLFPEIAATFEPPFGDHMDANTEKKIKLLESLVAALQNQVRVLKERNEVLEPENQGWLALWQKQQFEIDTLNSELSRLQSLRAEPRDGS